MAMPTYQTCFLPLLKFYDSAGPHTMKDAIDSICKTMGLTEEEKTRTHTSGNTRVIYVRVNWAKTFLYKAGLISQSSNRKEYEITERGRQALKQILEQNLESIDIKFLRQYEEFREFMGKTSTKEDDGKDEVVNITQTPEEALEYGRKALTENLASEIMKKIMECSPAFFENLVVELLVKMGYGGTFDEAAQVVGKTGDGGIDGIIKEDKLGLDVIYIQAKRWSGNVGSPEIQKFAGALLSKKSMKGIFITTSSFTKDAVEYVNNINNTIILIDGWRLTDLMIQYNLGVNISKVYEIKKLDSDYFVEE